MVQDKKNFPSAFVTIAQQRDNKKNKTNTRACGRVLYRDLRANESIQAWIIGAQDTTLSFAASKKIEEKARRGERTLAQSRNVYMLCASLGLYIYTDTDSCIQPL